MKENEEYLYNLLSFAQKANDSTEQERQSFYATLKDIFKPYILKELLTSKNDLVLGYVKTRYRELYVIQNSLEEDFVKLMDLDIESLEAFYEPADEDEYKLMLLESEKSRNGDPDFHDMIEAMEYLRYNFQVALTSPSAWIRTLTEVILEKEGRNVVEDS
jgi:hypothetical protein